MVRLTSLVAGAVLLTTTAAATARGDDFRVTPYLQNPASDAITIRWLSDTADPGSLSINGQILGSTPTLAATLAYQAAEPAGDRYPGLPWLHSVRVTGLSANTAYPYAVNQGASTAAGTVATPIPSAATSGLAVASGVRLFVYSDSETEPESAAARVTWAAPAGATRPAWVGDLYPATQTAGYTQNLAIVAARAAEAQAAGRATLIALPGDLVESGGWDVSIMPAYAFPLLSPTNPGEILGWERRTYDDVVRFFAVPEPNALLLMAVAATALQAGLSVHRFRKTSECKDVEGSAVLDPAVDCPQS